MSALGVASAGLAALQLAGGYFASENIKRSAALNERIAEANAEFAELDAYDAELEGFSESARYQSVIDATLGTQQAELAAADVDLNFGSAASVQKETRLIAELNKMEIQKRGRENALGYQRQASDIRLGGFLGAQQAKSQASTVLVQGALGAAKSGIQAYRSF